MRKPTRHKRKLVEKFVLPTVRTKPSIDPWQFAYLLLGEKKIGKTAFAIQGCEEYVLQFDKPQIGKEIRETVITDWKQFLHILKAIEEAAKTNDLIYQRIIIDGVAEWYNMCDKYICEKLGVQDLADAEWSAGWRGIKREFTNSVNRLLRLQITAECGLIFIAHTQWKEKPARRGSKEKIPYLTGSLSPACEEIINGKVDANFLYDKTGDDRILTIRGTEEVDAGHRIDSQFFTPGREEIREIYMGTSPKESLTNFLAAFNNEQTYKTYKCCLLPLIYF